MNFQIRIATTIPFCMLILVLLQGCIGPKTIPTLPDPFTIQTTEQVANDPEGFEIQKKTTPTIFFERTKRAAPTSTFRPTLTNDEMLKKVEGLLSKNFDCDLPCIWGFTPGKTKVNTVVNFFSNLGWSTEKLNGPLGNVHYTGKDVDEAFSLRLAFYEKKEMLAGISFFLNTPNFVKRDQWLSPVNVLKKYGKPDQVWVSINLGGEQGLEIIDQAGYEVYLFYKAPMVMIQYHGIAIHNQDTFSICLLSDDNFSHNDKSKIEAVHVYSGSEYLVATPEGLIKPFGKFNGKYTIEEVFKLSPQSFYDQMISSNQDTSSCLIAPDHIWRD